jgi:hypothetical protein
MGSMEFPQGLTVPELKSLVASWPDTDEDGAPLEVWVGTRVGMFRPIVRALTVTAPSERHGGKVQDLLLETDEVLA